jgi:type I restriction enzyme S subunit
MSDTTDYKVTKQSSLGWLERIPAHWEERRAKFFVREVDDRSESGLEELISVSHLTGVTPRSEKNVTMFKAESYVGHKICQPGDVVVNTMWAWMAALGVANSYGIVSPSYGVYRPELDRFASGYLDNLLRTNVYVAEYRIRSTGIQSSRLRLYPDQFLDIRLLCPPIGEQRSIAAYIRSIDRSVAEVVRTKRRQRQLLMDEEAAIIERLITTGLDPSTSVKPTVIEGVPAVPAHWTLSKVKYLARYLNGYAFKPAQWTDQGRKIIRIQNLTDPRAEYNCVEDEVPERYLIRDGDLLLSWSASLGVYIWRGESAWLNQHIFKVTPDVEIVRPDYYVWLAKWFLSYLAREAHGSTMQHLTRTKFGGVPVYLPPLDEQREIARLLDNQHRRIEEATSNLDNEVRCALELRARLATDAVTGQSDVRSIALPVDDEASGRDELAVLLAGGIASELPEDTDDDE